MAKSPRATTVRLDEATEARIEEHRRELDAPHREATQSDAVRSAMLRGLTEIERERLVRKEGGTT